jgi:hypothetical protein
MTKFFIISEDEYNATLTTQRIGVLKWVYETSQLNPDATVSDLVKAAHGWIKSEEKTYSYAPVEEVPAVSEPVEEVNESESEIVDTSTPEVEPETEEEPVEEDVPAPMEIPEIVSAVHNEDTSHLELSYDDPEPTPVEEVTVSAELVKSEAPVRPSFPTPAPAPVALNIKSILNEVRKIDTV